MITPLIASIFYALVCSVHGQMVSKCVNGTFPSKKDQLPAMPSTYRVNVALVDQLSKATADIIEQADGSKKVVALKKKVQNGEYQWIFNSASPNALFINEKSCDIAKWPTNDTLVGNPYNFPAQYHPAPFEIPKSLTDLIKLAQNSKVVFKDNVTTHEHGLPAEHWYGCSDIAETKVTIEYHLCFTPPDFKNVDPNITQGLVRMELFVFNTSTGSALEGVVYETSSFRSSFCQKEQESMFLPPVGIHCDVGNQSHSFPTIPDKFSVSVEYRDNTRLEIDSSIIHYDGPQHLISFTYSVNDTDEPVSTGLENKPGRYAVLHDFVTGIQYLLDELGDKCIDVGPIPLNHSSSEPAGRKLALRNPSEILFYLENLEYSYVGERSVGGVAADVWTAQSEVSHKDSKGMYLNESTVYELWFTHSNWTVNTGTGKSTKSVPLELRVYHRWTNGSESLSAQHFHDFVNYDVGVQPWKHFDVMPCLNITKNSYLLVKVNGSLDNVNKVIGPELFKSALRENLAKIAQVSPVQLTEFFTEETDGSVFVFFLMADMRYGISTTDTEGHRDQVPLDVALKNLNETLKKDVSFSAVRPDGTVHYLTIQNNTMKLIPSFLHPATPDKIITPKDGYTGGSMAALGICMLSIGGVLGIAVGFFLWKRNRGIAYQIYE